MFELKAVAQAKDKFEIMMYGNISQWEKANATDFKKSMDMAIAQGAKEIIFPTHSGGGSIYEGIAMSNAVAEARAKGIKTICRVDGLAASMAAVFAASCDEMHVAENSRTMVHEGRTVSIGTVTDLRNDADQLESLNSDIADVFAKKTGKTKEWIMENWLSGKDKWFNAQQAIDAKLADKKIGNVHKKIPAMAYSTPWEKMAASYDKIFNPDNTMKDQLIATLGLDANATDEQITAAVAAMKDKQAAPPASADATAGKPAASAPASAGEDKAVEMFMKIADERGVKDPKKLESLRIVAKANINAAFDLLPEKKEEDTLRLSDVIAQLKGGATGGSAERANWSFDDWQTKDPSGFHAMLQKEPKKYQELFKAQFGFAPSMEELQFEAVQKS